MLTFGFDTTAGPIQTGLIPIPSLANAPKVSTVAPPPAILPSGAVPSSVPPTSTVGTGGDFLTTFLNGFATGVSNLGAQSSQGGAIASGSVTASYTPSTAQQLLASPVLWIAGGAILLVLLLPKRGH